MSALVTRVWTVELAPTKWMVSRASVYRDLVEHSVKQVSVYDMTWSITVTILDLPFWDSQKIFP